VSPKTLEHFEQYYRRRVEKDEHPLWFGDLKDSDRFALYRVVSASPTVIRLSRSRAYDTTPTLATSRS
jgi:hypothetical protein